jgi:hypothetical protein
MGRCHFAATRDSSGSCVMIYAPVGRKFKVRDGQNQRLEG